MFTGLEIVFERYHPMCDIFTFFYLMIHISFLTYNAFNY